MEVGGNILIAVSYVGRDFRYRGMLVYDDSKTAWEEIGAPDQFKPSIGRNNYLPLEEDVAKKLCRYRP